MVTLSAGDSSLIGLVIQSESIVLKVWIKLVVKLSSSKADSVFVLMHSLLFSPRYWLKEHLLHFKVDLRISQKFYDKKIHPLFPYKCSCTCCSLHVQEQSSRTFGVLWLKYAPTRQNKCKVLPSVEKMPSMQVNPWKVDQSIIPTLVRDDLKN